MGKRELLRIRPALNSAVYFLGHFIHDVAFDGKEIAHSAVVHERMSAEDEGMVVDGRDGGAGGGADVPEAHPGFRVGADGEEVCVVSGWLDCFVHCWTQALGSTKEGRG